MYVQQLYTNCLSEAAYYIESDGEAAIIDPLRDTQQYIELAQKRNAQIKYIFETHFHADFVSGHIELSKKIGAPIIYGPGAKTSYPVTLATDGQIFELGKVKIKVLHTPGHTLESCCYLLHDENDKPHSLFTGDTLFVGDVGRPDLSSGNMSSEELAAIMYNTIQTKILPLADDIFVYPAHGAGSSCGKNLGSETFSTIGEQRKNNYALQPQSEEEFVKAVTEGLAKAPKYFSINARINQKGYDSLDGILQNAKALSVKEFEQLNADDVVILDVRTEREFTQGFIKGSIFVGLNGRFAEWAATILPFDKDIYIVANEGKEIEAITRLARVGLDNVKGFLNGGFDAWLKSGNPIDLIIDIEAEELAMDIPHDENAVVLDVRKESEYNSGHIKNATLMTLSEIGNVENISDLMENERCNYYIHCAGGYRSVIAASILKKNGIHNLRNVLGGWAKIKEVEKIEKA